MLEVFILKNFFVVINKEKIYAYIVSIFTIVTLFFVSSVMKADYNEVQSTSSNLIENEVNNTTDENS